MKLPKETLEPWELMDFMKAHVMQKKLMKIDNNILGTGEFEISKWISQIHPSCDFVY